MGHVKRLILAPHMDDEAMGCGGLLAKYPDECVVVIVTDSGAVRAAEHARAMEILGITDVRLLGFEDGTTDKYMTDLVRAIDAVMGEVRPDELYLPFPSLHQDHIAVYEAGMRSARVSMSADHHFPPTVLVYDIAAYDVNLYPTDLRWNVFESLTEDEVTKKARACAAYESEIPSAIHPINSVKQLAAAAGLVRLMPYAEQYALVRQVRR